MIDYSDTLKIAHFLMTESENAYSKINKQSVNNKSYLEIQRSVLEFNIGVQLAFYNIGITAFEN